MAYSASNPPTLMVPSIGAKPALWIYASTDVHTDVDATDYFTNGDDLGMVVNDVVIVVDTDTANAVTMHSVSAVTAGGAATVGSALLA